jgi:hypothetical protein
MGRGKGHLNVSTRPLTANRGNANGTVTGLRTRIAARAGGDAAESLLPVVVPTRATAAQAIAAHGVVDVAALDVTTTKASGGGDVRVGASCAKAEVATVDEVAVGEAEIRVDRDGVQVSPSVTALETEQTCAMRWGVAGLEEFCSRALCQRLQKSGARCPDLPGYSVSRHRHERGIGRQSQGRSRMQGRIAMDKSAPQRGTEGGTGLSVGAGGYQVKLREGSEARMCLWKGIVAMRGRCKEGRSVQRKGALERISAAIGDHAGGMEAETSLAKGEPELHAHQRVGQAHSVCCVGVGGKIENGEGCVLHRGLELGKRAQCKKRADHAREMGQATLERARAVN